MQRDDMEGDSMIDQELVRVNDRHRNGVSGMPFEVELRGIADQLLLRVHFEGSADPITIPIYIGEHLLAERRAPNKWAQRNGGSGFQNNNSTFLYGIQRLRCERGNPAFAVGFKNGRQRFLAVYEPDTNGNEFNPRFACFDLGMLFQGNVTFGENSWRGDDALGAIENQIGTSLVDYIAAIGGD